MDREALKKVKALFLDMDGVLWSDKEEIGNLHEIFDSIRESGLKVFFGSNNATRTPSEYCEKDTQQMNQCQSSTDDKTGNPTILSLGGGSKYSEDKDKGQYDFYQKRLADAFLEQAVGSKAHLLTDQGNQDAGTSQRAQDLCNDIAHKINGRHATVDQHTQGYCRIDMAAGDVADRISHRHDHQSESQCCQDIGRIRCSAAACYSCRAAAKNNQNCSSNEFC